MNRLIQPLSDVLTQYPDLSASIIVIVSTIFSAIAAAYVLLQEQEKSTLKAQIGFQRERAETCAGEREKMSGQIEKVQEIVQSKTKLNLELGRLQDEIAKLKRENLDMDNKLQLSKLQDNLNQAITANQADVTAIRKAISTQENRRSAFRRTREAQKKKNKLFSLFRKLRK